MSKSLSELEKSLGYTFQNIGYLEQAVRHSSYVNECHESPTSCNERLEFLGDSILGFTSAEFLYKNHPDVMEGDLSRTRASWVREESLFEVAQNLHLGDYMLLGKGEELSGGRERPSILADAVEAIFAAVFLDGGIEASKDLIHRVLLDKMKETTIVEKRKDYKSKLQEVVQSKRHKSLTYELIGSSGPDHDKTFSVAVQVNGETIGIGSGKSKKDAEQEAAKLALENFNA